MNKTLSIGLAGFSFTIEEHAYIKLSDYLSALRSSLDASEADEVMHDIEIRMVEIFKESLGKREVINDTDVEKVIEQIGSPEKIEEQEEAYFSEITTKSQQKSNGTFQKQLFRDPENAKLGGVCSGLAQYTGMEIIWMRVIWVAVFLIMIPAHGSALLVLAIYLVLWIVLPKAQTASDFLKMKGKPMNFDNLKEESTKIVQFTNEAGQKVGEIYRESKPLISSTGNGIWNVLRYLIGGIAGLVGLSLLFSSFAIISAGFDSNLINLPGNFQFYLQDGWLKFFGIAFGFLTILIPALIFLFISIKLFSPKTRLNYTGYVFGALVLLWIFLLASLGVKAIQYKAKYKGTNEETENISINTKSDSILVDVKKVAIPANFIAYGDEMYSDQKTIYQEDYPDVDITRKEGNFTPYLIIKEEADGYNLPLNIKVPVEIADNKILLPNYFSFPFDNKFREYRVNYELVVPKDKKVISMNEHSLSLNDEKDEDKDNNDDDKDSANVKINGNTITLSSENSDTIIINGKKYQKDEAQKILEKKLPHDLKDLKDLKDVNINVKDGKSEISIKTNK